MITTNVQYTSNHGYTAVVCPACGNPMDEELWEHWYCVKCHQEYELDQRDDHDFLIRLESQEAD